MEEQESNLIENIKKLKPVEKKTILNNLWVIKNPEFECKPAKNIQEFVQSEFYLNAKDECWDTVLDLLVEFYESKKHIGMFILPPGAGKSYLSGIIATHEVHQLLCYKEPHKRLKLASGSNIAIMNVSQNGQQAKKVVFGEIKARIDYSYWFQNFYKPNPDKRSELEFSKNIFIIPGNSSESNPFGYNLVVVIMDEVAWWEMSISKDYVKDLFETLEKRIGNRYGDDWNWKIVLITNPSYPDTYCEKLVESKDVFGVRKTIFEMKYWLFTKDLINWEGRLIPKEMYETAVKNPDSFKRDALAIPSETISPFIIDPKTALNKIMNNEIINPVFNETIDWEKVIIPKAKVNWHFDLGITGTAAGCCGTYKENGIIKPVLIYRKQGSPQAPVLLSDMRQIVITFRDRGGRVGKISYDGFASEDSLQILRNLRFDVEQLSVDKDSSVYDTLKEVIYSFRIQLPMADWDKIKILCESPTEWLYKELSELERHKLKIDHRPKGSKDMSDALAGSVFHTVLEPDIITKVKISGSETRKGIEISANRDEEVKSAYDDIR